MQCASTHMTVQSRLPLLGNRLPNTKGKAELVFPYRHDPLDTGRLGSRDTGARILRRVMYRRTPEQRFRLSC